MELDLAHQKCRNIFKGVTVTETQDLLQVFVAALRCLAKSDGTGTIAVSKVCTKVFATNAIH